MNKRIGLMIVSMILLSACHAGARPTSTPGSNATPPPVTRAPTSTPAPVATPVSSAPPVATATAAPSPIVTGAPSTTAASPTPAAITLTGDDGQSITLAGPPQKVVSLTPATSELMFALGAGDRLVGRTDYDDYPPEVADVPAVATFEGVEIEKVVDAAPDLVIAGGNGFTHQADIDQLRSLDIPVLVVYAADLPGVLSDIELVGTAVGEANAAQAITADIKSSIDEVTGAVSGTAMQCIRGVA